MRISDWSSDVCSSDLLVPLVLCLGRCADRTLLAPARQMLLRFSVMGQVAVALVVATGLANTLLVFGGWPQRWATAYQLLLGLKRSEEHTSELQSLMRISYAVFCLKKNKKTITHIHAPLLLTKYTLI